MDAWPWEERADPLRGSSLDAGLQWLHVCPVTLPYLPRANWSTSRPVIQLTGGGAQGRGVEACSRIFLCKICTVKGSALTPSPFWSQHRPGPPAWYSLERRKERAGAIREGFLEEGVGFRWAEGRAEPWQTQGLGRSLLPSQERGPGASCPCRGALAAPPLCPQGRCSQREVLAESSLPAAGDLRSNFQLAALQGLKSRPLSPGEVIRPNLPVHVGHQDRPGNADSGPGTGRLG